MVFLFGPLVYHGLQAHPSPKVCQSHLLATLTQFLAQLRCETGIPGRNFVTVDVQLFQAGLWVNLEFGRISSSEK